MKRAFYFIIIVLLCFWGVGLTDDLKPEKIYAADSGRYIFYKWNSDMMSEVSWELKGDCLTIDHDGTYLSYMDRIDEVIGSDVIKKACKLRIRPAAGIENVIKNKYSNIVEVEFYSIPEMVYRDVSVYDDFAVSEGFFDMFPNLKKISFIGTRLGNNYIDFSKNKIDEIYVDGEYPNFEKIWDGFKGIVTYKNNYKSWKNVTNSVKKGIVYKKLGSTSLKNAEIDLKKCFYTYDGSAKTPTVIVNLGGKILSRDEDYTLEYKNNYDDGIATIYIVGQHDYCDIVEMNYVILPYNPGMEAVYDDGAFIEGRFVYGITDEEDNEVEVYCPAKSGIKTADIPDTVKYDGVEYKVTSIGNKAFYRNRKLQSVEIGDNIESIENYAFYGCTKLADVKLGSNVEEIGASAFRKCTKLKSIVLPKSVSELGKNVFFGCKRLKSITIKSKKVIDIKKNAIKGISSKATIKVSSKKLVKAYSKKLTKKTGYKKTMTIKKK